MTDDRALETLVVGIDAACQGVLDPLFRRGALPNLRSVVEAGASGPLESQLPPWTPSAWPSMYTGTNPGKHGVFSFLEYEGYDWDVVDATAVREPTLWELLDHHGLTSVVVNGPVTAPPPRIDGAVVPGFTAPEHPACHPDGLLDELAAAIDGYRVYSDHEFDDMAPTDAKVAEYRQLIRMRGDAFCYLVDQFDPDFGFVQFQQTDTVVHDFPGDQGVLGTVYEAVDEQLGRILDHCGPRTVVVASDHGIGEYAGVEFRVNEFLRQHGYLQATRDGRGMPSWVPIWADIAQRDRTTEADGTRSGLEMAVGAAEAVGLTPALVAAAVDRLGLAAVARRLVPEAVLRVTDVGEVVDFEQSTAYMRLPSELGIRLNLAGREPRGVVAPDEYEAVRAELIGLLEAVETPAGEPVFERVVPREAVFSGPAVEKAVDIVTVPNGFDRFPSARLGRSVFGPPNEPWNHKLDGFLAVAGPDVRPAALDGARLLDVAPTVLATFGLPRSDRMDGRVLPVVDPAGQASYPPPERRPRDVAGGDVASRLETLGYL